MQKAPEQIATLKILTQGAAAFLLGVSARHLRDQPDAPRDASGSYDGRQLVRWIRAKAQAESDALRLDDTEGGDSPALERYRAARAELAELDVAQRHGALIPREAAKAALLRWATIIKRAGERLGKRYGADATATLNVALDECGRVIEAEFGEPDAWGEHADA